MTHSFGATSTTDEVLQGIDLTDKRVLVTGVSAGLGTETARSLAAHGAEVVGTVRDLSKAQGATEAVRSQAAHGGSLQLVQLDLASLESVRRCADVLLAAGKPFDVIIANAGVMACPKGTTVDGFETQFGTNHLGHFVLVNRIASLLRRGSRLVNLSSAGHRYSDVDLDDPNFERTPYAEFVAYGRSKTANVLFAVEFDRRHKAKGIRATAVHPGTIRTELGRHMGPGVLEKVIADMNANRPKDAPPLQLEEHSARCGNLRMGGLGRRCRGHWGPILRGLPRCRHRFGARACAAACSPTRSIPNTPRHFGKRAKSGSVNALTKPERRTIDGARNPVCRIAVAA